ncbi:MAG: hypothetical protein ACRCSG_00275 [Cellulosilyticaceae bacterium]
MNILEQLDNYKKYVQNDYNKYTSQKQAIELLDKFLKFEYKYKMKYEKIEKVLDYFVLVWVPKRKKYLKEAEGFEIIHTVRDFKNYIETNQDILNYENSNKDEIEQPWVIDKYIEDYMRVHKVKKIISEMTKDPVVGTDTRIIDLKKYKEFKEKQQHNDSMSIYEQGTFKIQEINKEGYLELSKIGNSKKYCKILCRQSYLNNFKEGDLLEVNLRKKVFFIYWEIETLKAYYSEAGSHYLI